jgi:hypothetical protein
MWVQSARTHYYLTVGSARQRTSENHVADVQDQTEVADFSRS